MSSVFILIEWVNRFSCLCGYWLVCELFATKYFWAYFNPGSNSLLFSIWSTSTLLLYTKCRQHLIKLQSSVLSYPKDFVQCEFPQLRAHGCLRQLSHCILWVLHAVAGLPTEWQSDIRSNQNKAKQSQWVKSLHLPWKGPGFSGKERHLSAASHYLYGTRQRQPRGTSIVSSTRPILNLPRETADCSGTSITISFRLCT